MDNHVAAKLHRLSKHFLPGDLNTERYADLIRAQFFVISVILFIVGTITFLMSWVAIVEDLSMPLEWSFISLSLAIQFASLWDFYENAKIDRSSQILVWFHYALLVVIISLSGGAQSPFILTLIVLPVVCGFVINARHCKVMLLLSLISLVVFNIVDAFGISLEQDYFSDFPQLRYLLFIIGLVLVMAVFAFYEMMLGTLKQALIDEKNRFLHYAEYDVLTGLLSYKAFDQILNANLSRKNQFAVFYVDLENFKRLNTEYGHMVGDRLLQQVAARMSNAIRNDDVVARMKSDEFGIIVNDITRATDLKHIADSIRQAIEVNIEITEGQSIQLKASIGFSHNLSGVESKSTLISLAKASMK